MSFTVYPAIDIRGGKCVRLFQGDYSQESTYYDSPLEPAKKWFDAGAQWLHIIDLDGAKTGKPENLPIIKDILAKLKIKIQVGGGIRTMESAQAYLDGGANRVIIGSQALKDIKFVENLLAAYGSERIVVSLDGRKDQVFSDGWLKNSGSNLFTAAKELAQVGVKTFIYTDIEKDGTLSGPNINQTRDLAISTGCELIAAGGIATSSDVLALADEQKSGIAGAIIGKALYTGSIDLKALITELREVKGCQ